MMLDEVCGFDIAQSIECYMASRYDPAIVTVTARCCDALMYVKHFVATDAVMRLKSGKGRGE